MEIIYRKKFLKEAKRLPPKSQEQLKEVFDKLQQADSLESAGVDYKYMEGQQKGQNYYRIRIGGWRIGVEYLNPDLIAVTVASRGDIYKGFPPK
ncbi:type II toxin-antitoxin system RelE family toxin [Salmonirosea aquatica]|uniref:Type II toxin-antitoxin system RelE/ParE family toxin n=1 Tax=Salmonirosea aquatica TaxID=2654236 RepID=A0A7C9FD94_9BACT|nr:hypothetical protein [Cytophagaceae bacterium SJW1-29]